MNNQLAQKYQYYLNECFDLNEKLLFEKKYTNLLENIINILTEEEITSLDALDEGWLKDRLMHLLRGGLLTGTIALQQQFLPYEKPSTTPNMPILKLDKLADWNNKMREKRGLPPVENPTKRQQDERTKYTPLEWLKNIGIISLFTSRKPKLNNSEEENKKEPQ